MGATASSLVARGLCGARFIVGDAHPGLAAARSKSLERRNIPLPKIPWQGGREWYA